MLKIGGLVFHLYGLLIALGVLAGFWSAGKMRKKLSENRAWLRSVEVWDGLWWVLIPAVVGARIYHVIDLWDYYRKNLTLIPAVWTGGLGIFGAIIGGLVGLWFFTRLRQFSFLTMLDLVGFGLPVGQAIGRWGNFFNQELYGRPTDLPWGIAIDLENRLVGFKEFTYFHPLFLYESLWSLLVFGILVLIWRVKGNKLISGTYFSIYLVLSGVGRFWLEGLRIQAWEIAGIRVAQIMSISFIIIGSWFLVRNKLKSSLR